jgi:hypothetical protein
MLLKEQRRLLSDAIAPALTTHASAISFKLSTHRAIAPLKQNLGKGDLFSATGNAIALCTPNDKHYENMFNDLI